MTPWLMQRATSLTLIVIATEWKSQGHSGNANQRIRYDTLVLFELLRRFHDHNRENTIQGIEWLLIEIRQTQAR